MRSHGRRMGLVIVLVGAVFFSAGCSVMYVLTGHKEAEWPPENVVPLTPIYHHGGWLIARGSLHNHTLISDGVRTPEQLIELARMEGIAVLACTDHREGKIAIGRWLHLPINGIERIGYAAYFDRIESAASQAGDIIVLVGIEVVPYFYNVGRAPFFVIFNQNHHFTVYQIRDPEVYENMPARRSIPSLRPEPLVDLEPYEEFVDYFVDRGGIVHAVHVESKQDMWPAGPFVHLIDRSHPEVIRSLKRLTGFSVVPEAWQHAGAPGGDWDAALIEYLVGGRESVPWAVGDADYHGPDGSLTRGTTLFYLREFTEEEVYAALREGRMVALMGEMFQDVYVAEFSAASTGSTPADLIMFGQKVGVSAPPVLRFRLDHEVPGVRTQLLRNGRIIAETPGSSLEFTDHKLFEQNLPGVYRVIVSGSSSDGSPRLPQEEQHLSLLFTNPIFVYPLRAEGR